MTLFELFGSLFVLDCFPERVAIPPRTKLLTTGSPRPSAHLTLRDSGLQGEFASMFGCVHFLGQQKQYSGNNPTNHNQ